MAIYMVKIRALVIVGRLSVRTPYVLSFSVDKTRGQPSSFQASLKVKANEVTNISGGPIEIWAGEGDANNQIFTGIVRSVNITPCRDDPEYVILNLGGTDILAFLQGKKFTRRCRTSKGVWVGIESVTRPGLKSGKFSFVPEKPSFKLDSGQVWKGDATVKTRVNQPDPEAQAPPRNAKEQAPVISIFPVTETPSGS